MCCTPFLSRFYSLNIQYPPRFGKDNMGLLALEPTVLWEIKKDDIERLSMEHSDIGVLYRKFFEYSLIDSQIKADTLRFEPAHERYNKLLQLHPEILKRAPLVYIASLLQMTPETLSRVRSASLNG